jgi:low affinity Fe/Cu permease
VQRTEFQAHLKRQLEFMYRSCESYDAGFCDEAIRIATCARVLLHQTNSSTSLLKHLNGTTINLLTTCSPIPPGTMFSLGMGVLQTSEQGLKYVPALGNRSDGAFVPFSKWWAQTVMVANSMSMTRRKVVLNAANRDGGAHVDPKLDEDYRALSQPGFMDTIFVGNETESHEKPIEGSHLLCLRQIGYELLHSPQLTALLDG